MSQSSLSNIFNICCEIYTIDNLTDCSAITFRSMHFNFQRKFNSVNVSKWTVLFNLWLLASLFSRLRVYNSSASRFRTFMPFALIVVEKREPKYEIKSIYLYFMCLYCNILSIFIRIVNTVGQIQSDSIFGVFIQYF